MKYVMGKPYLPSRPHKAVYIKGLVGCLVVGIIAVLAFAHASHKPPAPVTVSTKSPIEAGISTGSIEGRSSNLIKQQLAGTSKLGFNWVRLDINWPEVQPHDSKKLNWSLYDSAIADARRDHLKILAILDYAPAWAGQPGCAAPKQCAPKDPAQFAAFAAQAAQRYKSSVQSWEIWNEENISQFWSPAPNAVQYAAVLKQSYQSIKAVDPKATVVLGGTAPGDNPATNEVDAVTFMQQLYQAGVKGSFDAVAYHPYTYPSTPLDANTAWDKLASLHSMMQAHGDGAKQIWITEYGAPTNGPKGSDFVSETAQAQMARDAFAAARSKAWIGPFFWYSYQDAGTSTTTKENFFGLRRADGSPKPAYYAWQQLLEQ